MLKNHSDHESAPGGAVRVQKFLSDAGVASRRHAEEMILDGRVSVNGAVLMQLPAFVDPQRDDVRVDGRRVRVQAHEYFLANKPKGFVCTNDDPSGRPMAVELLPQMEARLFVVGRLDVESTGLLLLTNDGELAQRVTDPRSGLTKVYRATVRGRVGDDLPARLKRGVYLSEGRARANDVVIIHRDREVSTLEITLGEGPNRQVRRMLAGLGYPVRQLKRISIGPLTVKAIPLGASRRMTERELSQLKKALDQPAAAPVAGPEKKPGVHVRPKMAKRKTGPRKPKRRPAAAEGGPVVPLEKPKRRLIT